VKCPVTGLDEINYIGIAATTFGQRQQRTVFRPMPTPATVWPSTNITSIPFARRDALALRIGCRLASTGRLTNGIMIEYVDRLWRGRQFCARTDQDAIRQLVSHWYEHRGEAATTATNRAASSADRAGADGIQALLDPYRVRRSSF